MKLVLSNRFQLRPGSDAPRLMDDGRQITFAALVDADAGLASTLHALIRQRADHPLAEQFLRLHPQVRS